jgi:periplasmic copper chaperone A
MPAIRARCDRRTRRRGLSALTVLVVTVLLVGCGGAADPGSGGGPSATGGAPTVSDAWIRPPMAPGLPGAGYLTLTGAGSEDALVAAATDAAARVELHRTMAGMSGMAGMEPVDRIKVPATGSVRLEPGSFHLMLFDLPSEMGTTVPLRLTFASGAEVEVIAEVRGG